MSRLTSQKSKSRQSLLIFTQDLEKRQEPGSRTRIFYSDSGRGLAIDILREKALAVRLIEADASDTEVAMTLFHAGISSASHVTDVSGRGIGMNAVAQFIKELGGTIHIVLKEPGLNPGFRYFAFEIELPQQMNPKTWEAVQDTLPAQLAI